MTTDDIRAVKAMALLECFEAREEFRQAETSLQAWRAKTTNHARALADLLHEESSAESHVDWEKAKREASAIDSNLLEQLVSNRDEAATSLNKAKRKLEEYRLEFD